MTIEVLRCLLLPVQGSILMLPYSAVAEVVPLQNPASYGVAKDWVLGKFEWRGLLLPLICIEMLDSPTTQFHPLPTQHVAILNRASSNMGPDFIGIVLAGIPSMSRYKSTDLHYIADGDKPYVQMKATARSTPVSIPDLEWIAMEIQKKI